MRASIPERRTLRAAEPLRPPAAPPPAAADRMLPPKGVPSSSRATRSCSPSCRSPCWCTGCCRAASGGSRSSPSPRGSSSAGTTGASCRSWSARRPSTGSPALLIARAAPPDGTRRRRSILVVALVANVAVLGYFKYRGFFLDSLDGLGSLGRPRPRPARPARAAAARHLVLHVQRHELRDRRLPRRRDRDARASCATPPSSPCSRAPSPARSCAGATSRATSTASRAA